MGNQIEPTGDTFAYGCRVCSNIKLSADKIVIVRRGGKYHSTAFKDMADYSQPFWSDRPSGNFLKLYIELKYFGEVEELSLEELSNICGPIAGKLDLHEVYEGVDWDELAKLSSEHIQKTIGGNNV